MTRERFLTIAVLSLLLLNLGTIGFLWLRPPGGLRSGGPPDGQTPTQLIIDRLHLDDRQQVAYRRLIQDHRQQSRALAEESVGLYRRYYQLLEAAQPDTARASALSQQIAQKQRAIAELNFNHFAQIKALCRPDQQADFAGLVGDLTELFNRPPRPNRP